MKNNHYLPCSMRLGEDTAPCLVRAVRFLMDVGWHAEAEQALDHLEMLRQQAQQDPRWASFAHEMGMWANDQGNISFGVRPDSPHAEDAFAAEYGDAEHPPSPQCFAANAAVPHQRTALTRQFRKMSYSQLIR